MINGIISVIVAYLLGSIPSAYIVTRLKTGNDIRKLGEGNAGARNVYHHVGLPAAIIVGILDIGKGVAAVVIACFVLDAPEILLLAAGLAAVTGHIWSIYLKFTGGNGIATTIGVLSVIMTRELLIALAVMIVIVVITRNLILSVNISLLLAVPVSSVFLRELWLPYVIFSIILALVLVLHFLPTAKAALVKAGSREKLTAELMRADKAKKAARKK